MPVELICDRFIWCWSRWDAKFRPPLASSLLTTIIGRNGRSRYGMGERGKTFVCSQTREIGSLMNTHLDITMGYGPGPALPRLLDCSKVELSFGTGNLSCLVEGWKGPVYTNLDRVETESLDLLGHIGLERRRRQLERIQLATEYHGPLPVNEQGVRIRPQRSW
jgi:hypothetical protein